MSFGTDVEEGFVHSDGEDDGEELTDNLTLTVNDEKGILESVTVTVSVSQTSTAEGAKDDAVKGKYIELPKEASQEFIIGTNIELDGEGKYTKNDIEFIFTWGEKFGNENPAEFCNDKYAEGEMDATEATELLKGFEDSLANTKRFSVIKMDIAY